MTFDPVFSSYLEQLCKSFVSIYIRCNIGCFECLNHRIIIIVTRISAIGIRFDCLFPTFRFIVIIIIM